MSNFKPVPEDTRFLNVEVSNRLAKELPGIYVDLNMYSSDITRDDIEDIAYIKCSKDTMLMYSELVKECFNTPKEKEYLEFVKGCAVIVMSTLQEDTGLPFMCIAHLLNNRCLIGLTPDCIHFINWHVVTNNDCIEWYKQNILGMEPYSLEIYDVLRDNTNYKELLSFVREELNKDPMRMSIFS